MILGRLGLDIGPAVAGLGVVGIAVGFGAQILVRDYLNGALILIENQYAKGDVVRIGGVAGTVEDFTLRRTTLRDLDGVVHTVPNGEVKVASNLTRVWSRINQDVTVAYGTDIDKATEVVDAVGREMAADPAGSAGSSRRRASSASRRSAELGVTLKILGTVRAPDQWAAERRAAQAPPRRVPRQRHRDPAPPARRRRPTSRTRSAGRRPPRPARRTTSCSPTSRRRRTGSRAPARPAGRTAALECRTTVAAGGHVSVDPTQSSPEIENLLAETRTFPPDPAFTAQANATAGLYTEAEADFEAFWARLARERIDWFEPFHTTLEWDLPFAKWFTGGKLNISYNCLDRHVANGLGDKVAYHWIGEPGDTRTITYADLLREVSQDGERAQGARRRDRRPGRDLHADDPGAAHRDARLRPARGAAHGHLRRLQRRGAVRPHQRRRGEAASSPPTAAGGAASPRRSSRPWTRRSPLTPTIEHILVVRRLGDDLPGGTAMTDGRDVWWHDIVDRQSEDCPAGPARLGAHAVPALHVGDHGQAQGHHAHDRGLPPGGDAYTHEMVFDIKPDDVYWCAADIGWVTGH